MRHMTEVPRATGPINRSRLALVSVLSVGAIVASGALSLAASSAAGERFVGLYVALFTTLSAVFVLALLPMARRAGATFAPYVVALALVAQWIVPAFSTVFEVGLNAPFEPLLGYAFAGRNGSSAVPLQLSSSESQSSVRGTTSPGHVVPHEPATHVCVPLRHVPTPDVPVGPV